MNKKAVIESLNPLRRISKTGLMPTISFTSILEGLVIPGQMEEEVGFTCKDDLIEKFVIKNDQDKADQIELENALDIEETLWQ
ncbi:hypothetical protein MTR_6g054190 [Medicago truncatula]|uniref:Uncharacterized protein n=1 Tax=Medicago truncatula TaxID=3880 RepID=A0A072UKR6_MEDTR|nr:hypothetical protein MTR_6g054190 [Medicago truncatula]